MHPPPMPPLCWSCHTPLAIPAGPSALFCPACGAVQPPRPEASLFAALSLPEAFPLDRAALEAAYLAAQRQLHPDRLRDRTAREQLFAEQHAMHLNEAYTTLRDPLRRARDLLTRRGYTQPEGETVQDPEILLESLSDREALAEATTPEALAALAATQREQQQASEARLAAAFAANDLTAAAREALRLGYVIKFGVAVREKLGHGGF